MESSVSENRPERSEHAIRSIDRWWAVFFDVEFEDQFKKIFSKLKDPMLKEKIIKQIMKLKENPELGKPMRYTRKGTREMYISPFRLSYLYISEQDLILMLDLYHKDDQ